MMNRSGSLTETDRDYHIKRLLFFMINSTLIYILTYLLTYLEFQIITLLFARIVGIRGALYYYEICFAVSTVWSTAKIIFVTAAGPIGTLLTGLLILAFFRKWRQLLSPYLRLFLLWTGFHCFNFFMGGIISGTITGIGFGYAVDYLFNRPVVIYVFLDLIVLVVLFLFGYRYSRTFLGASPSRFWVQKGYKSRYLLFTGFFSWLFGSVFLFLLKYPDHDPQHVLIVFHDFLLMITMGCIVTAMLFYKRDFALNLKVTSTEKERKIHWGFAMSTIILLVMFRLLLTSSFYSLFG
jgi:hypothetical protein